MNEFLEFFNDKRRDFPMHLDINYSKVCDWQITIRKLGCAKDYPDALHIGNNVIICYEQDIDMELCFAKAHVALKQWLLEFEEGY